MHIIRLRHPWEKQTAGRDTISRVDVPESIGDLQGTQSTFLYRRRFNRPSGLDGASKVHLRIAGWTGHMDSITLNDRPLEVVGDSINVDVTDLLQRRNVCELMLRGSGNQSVCLSGEVVLVIT